MSGLKKLKVPKTKQKDRVFYQIPEYDYAELAKKVRDNVTVDSNGCWRWNLYIHKSGRGMIYVSALKRPCYANIISFMTFKGRVPRGNVRHVGPHTAGDCDDADCRDIKHRMRGCSTAICVNPEHLIEGSAAENSMDTIMIGENSGSSFGPDTIIEIRDAFEAGLSCQEISDALDIDVAETVKVIGVQRLAMLKLRNKR